MQITTPGAAAAAPLAPSRAVYHSIKRVFDAVAAFALLIILLPVMLLIGLAIYLDSGLPIIYRCHRLGRHGRPMIVFKFRTMRDGSHHHLEELLSVDEELRLEYSVNRKLRRDPRKTRVGGLLRRTSLDELPQLFNVLAGEMSLVGPRPYMPGELHGRPEAEELLGVRPGITGLWQVNGRADRSFEDRIALDTEYVRRAGVGLDVVILARTVSAVLTGRGAY